MRVTFTTSFSEYTTYHCAEAAYVILDTAAHNWLIGDKNDVRYTGVIDFSGKQFIDICNKYIAQIFTFALINTARRTYP